MKLSTTLDDEMSKQFQIVKEDTGMRANSNVLNLLISKEYQRIQQAKTHKVFLPEETYRKLEVQAKEKGLASVDEYVADIIKEFSQLPPEAY